MKTSESQAKQEQILNEICQREGIEYVSLKTLLESVKTKKLIKRNNYHQQTINDIIEKAIK